METLETQRVMAAAIANILRPTWRYRGNQWERCVGEEWIGAKRTDVLDAIKQVLVESYPRAATGTVSAMRHLIRPLLTV